MNAKKTQALVELEALLGGLEREAPAGELAPLVEGLQSRLSAPPQGLDASMLEKKLSGHIMASHEERLGSLWLDVCLNQLYRLDSLRSNLYSEAEGVRDPVDRVTLEARSSGLPEPERTNLTASLELATAESLVRAARGGLERWGHPSFLAYEASGRLGQGDARRAMEILQPLTELSDRTGYQSSALSLCAAAAQSQGSMELAATWAIRCHEEDVAAPVLLPVAFLHALRAENLDLCFLADSTLHSRFTGSGDNSAFVAAVLRRNRAGSMGPESSLSPGAKVLARDGARFRSTIAQRICHALA